MLWSARVQRYFATTNKETPMEITRNAAGVPQKIVMKRNTFDAHVHLREGPDLLRLLVPMTTRRFMQFIVMPNTQPPITTYEQLEQYRLDIMSAVLETSTGADDELVPTPWMTFYLTDTLDPTEVALAVPGDAIGVKLYPEGATTNSAHGVTDITSLWTPGTCPYQVLRVLAAQGGALLIHAASKEDANGKILDPYDQEVHFMGQILGRIRDAHPDLKMTIEHLSTAFGANYMLENGGPLLGCSLTVHHLLLDRRDVFAGGMHPHLHCWPVIQPEEHRDALRNLAGSGKPFVFLGTDSAPHVVGKKLCDCALGGLFTAPAALELYAEAFEDMGCLPSLEAFATENAAAFYGITLDEEELAEVGTLTLVREPWIMDPYFGISQKPVGTTYHDWLAGSCLQPFRASEEIRWKLVQE